MIFFGFFSFMLELFMFNSPLKNSREKKKSLHVVQVTDHKENNSNVLFWSHFLLYITKSWHWSRGGKTFHIRCLHVLQFAKSNWVKGGRASWLWLSWQPSITFTVYSMTTPDAEDVTRSHFGSSEGSTFLFLCENISSAAIKTNSAM